MSSIVIAGDTSGSVTLQAPAVAGSTVLNLPATSGTIQTSGAGYTTNGVAYASSTSALTTGSALTFDGTNLGLGVSSPAAKFAISSGTTDTRMYIQNTTTGTAAGNGLGLFMIGTDSYMFNYNGGILFGASGFEGMRLNSTGLLVGITSSFGKVTVNVGDTSPAVSGNITGGLTLANTGFGRAINFGVNETGGYSYIKTSYVNNADVAVPLAFFTGGNAERARIDSSGRFLLGATSVIGGFGGTRMYVVQSVAADYSAVFDSTSSTAANCYGTLIKYSAASPNTSSNEFFVCSDSTATRATIRSNGGLANYSANNVNLSDRREKTNFAPANSYLNKICAIPVQTFNYLDQNLEQDDGLTLGVVAQDVQAVAPELVMESNWGTEEEPKMRLSIYQTDLQYALMKCIQEQQALINTLTERISVLENK